LKKLKSEKRRRQKKAFHFAFLFLLLRFSPLCSIKPNSITMKMARVLVAALAAAVLLAGAGESQLGW
jgi:hypothetical protein